MVTSPSTPSFPSHARAVARSVRGAFSDALTSVGADARNPQSISRTLGLNKNLAWKIAKIVEAEDPSVALEQMPGAAGIKLFLDGAARAGANAAMLQSARDAVKEYEQLIHLHSGDRATLEMMGTELGSAKRQERDEHHRRLLFQGASYIWGAQARVLLKVGVVGPSAERGMLDFASLGAVVDFRRIRHDVTWAIASRYHHNDDGSVMSPRTEAIDPRFNSPSLAPVMADFCSQPTPELRPTAGPGRTVFELVEGPVGNTGSLTCVVGTIQRGIPYWRSAANEWGEHAAVCDLPAELLIMDLYVHEGLGFGIPPESILRSEIGVHRPGTGERRLPLGEHLQDLGAGLLPLATPEVPRYQPMLEAVFRSTGWPRAQFHGFRMRIAYPVYPSSLVLRYRLPVAP
jgi:hypothetical protein